MEHIFQDLYKENFSISFESYKVFYHVATLSSTTQAAEVLFLTQPAVSKSIHNLESELGCSLFNRTQKGMVLTEEGKILYKYISNAYNNIMMGQKKLWQMINMENGLIRIGTDEMTVYFDLLPKLEAFNVKHPKIKMEVMSYRRPGLIKGIKEGEIDFGVIMAEDEKYENLEIHELNTVKYSFIVGPKYKEMTKRRWTLEEIIGYPIISLEKDMSARKHLNDYFIGNGLLFRPDIELTTTSLIVPFAERNLGIGIVARHFAEDSMRQERCFEIQVTPAIPDRRACIINGKKHSISLAAKQFLSEIFSDEGDEKKL
ncbi:MAG: LysR family transcriptional regulator [Anaerovorax sp.]|nr:LysR family transcriptional regulator [Anaerovorax sp.]